MRIQGETDKIAAMLSKLSPKEEHTLRLVGRGLSNREIAEVMGVQEKTAKFHMSNLLSKLWLRNRVEAALIAQKYLGEAPGAPRESH
jgi:DNA-binding NarL/FixJ family response regulator